MARRNGVDLALQKAAGDGAEMNPETRGSAATSLAELLGVSVPAIYKFRRSGYFPLDRAKAIAEAYDIPLAELVRDDVREALLANNS